jgi:hypothetical protein
MELGIIVLVLVDEQVLCYGNVIRAIEFFIVDQENTPQPSLKRGERET